MINAVIDVSHHNGTSLDFNKAKADGIVGVIHKASQGMGNLDALYKTNRKKATAAGMLWGAYHFATGGDGAKQADIFLNAVGDPAGVLMVLDFEPNTAGPTMDLNEAHTFVTHIFQATGRWPGFYSGHLIKDLLKGQKDPILANCWLWLAQYGATAVVQPTWPTWTMWQYTDGSDGKEPVKGIGHCDRDRFNGDEDHLRTLWLGH